MLRGKHDNFVSRAHANFLFNKDLLKEIRPSIHPSTDPLNFYVTNIYHVRVSIFFIKNNFELLYCDSIGN